MRIFRALHIAILFTLLIMILPFVAIWNAAYYAGRTILFDDLYDVELLEDAIWGLLKGRM